MSVSHFVDLTLLQDCMVKCLMKVWFDIKIIFTRHNPTTINWNILLMLKFFTGGLTWHFETLQLFLMVKFFTSGLKCHFKTLWLFGNIKINLSTTCSKLILFLACFQWMLIIDECLRLELFIVVRRWFFLRFTLLKDLLPPSCYAYWNINVNFSYLKKIRKCHFLSLHTVFALREFKKQQPLESVI